MSGVSYSFILSSAYFINPFSHLSLLHHNLLSIAAHMDDIEATPEFQDWELLQANSDSKSSNSFPEIDSGGLIQTNYFSLDSKNSHVEEVGDDKSVTSDNPSWIDPGLEENPVRYDNKESGEFWSDSSSERSEDRKFSVLEGRNEMGFPENEKNKVDFEGIEEIVEESRGIGPGSAKVEDVVENSGVDVEVQGNLHPEPKVLGEEENRSCKAGSGGEVLDAMENKKTGGVEKRSLVWWKMPIEFLKYCVFRMNPVWSVSVAAAVMGFVILGRRLYKMKKKARGLEIKVTVDDKKVSQVMHRVALLNEAFSVVKRVPVIRPSLPAGGPNTTWPAMSLR